MLVLSRKRSESIVIGSVDGLETVLKVTVLEIRGGRVKLGFEAETAVRIRRSEVGETAPPLHKSNLQSGAAVSKLMQTRRTH
ncbi:MAG: carbon storage regulator [Deltaproteobacteria bacterium]